jgi:hypothetical protein
MLYRTIDRWLTSAITMNNVVCTLGMSHDEHKIIEDGLDVPSDPEASRAFT